MSFSTTISKMRVVNTFTTLLGFKIKKNKLGNFYSAY
ncbi:hypothetical protein [Acinetobacter nosocomialis]